MDNIRPLLEGLAQTAVSNYLANSNNTTLSLEVSKIAKTAGLDSVKQNLLIGITNKKYIETTGSMEFELASPEQVENHRYSEIQPKTASYNFYDNLNYNNYNYFQKSASVVNTFELEKQADLVNDILNKEFDFLNEYAFYQNKSASLEEELIETIGTLKNVGFSLFEIESNIKKASFVGEEFGLIVDIYNKLNSNNFIDPHAKYLRNYDNDFQKLANLAYDLYSIYNLMSVAYDNFNQLNNYKKANLIHTEWDKYYAI